MKNVEVPRVGVSREVNSTLSLGSRSHSRLDPYFHELCHYGKHLGDICYKMKSETVNACIMQ